MRNLVLLLAMALSMSATAAPATVDSAALTSAGLLGGDNPFPHSPFPLTCPQDFELRSMEGRWELLDARDDIQRYSVFEFEDRFDCENRELLRIRQFNVITGEVLGEGVGYREEKRDVKAYMKGKNGKDYMLFVGVYKNVDPNSKYPLNFVAPVLRLIPLDSTSGGKGYVIRHLQENVATIPGAGPSSTLTCDQ